MVDCTSHHSACDCREEMFQHIEEENTRLKQEVGRLRALLTRARKFVESDVLMMADISRHAPLPPESQAIHDSTEYLSDALLHEIDSEIH